MLICNCWVFSRWTLAKYGCLGSIWQFFGGRTVLAPKYASGDRNQKNAKARVSSFFLGVLFRRNWTVVVGVNLCHYFHDDRTGSSLGTISARYRDLSGVYVQVVRGSRHFQVLVDEMWLRVGAMRSRPISRSNFGRSIQRPNSRGVPKTARFLTLCPVRVYSGVFPLTSVRRQRFAQWDIKGFVLLCWVDNLGHLHKLPSCLLIAMLWLLGTRG